MRAMGATDWIAVEHRPEWADSMISDYRIEERQTETGTVQQRHIWKHKDGAIRSEEWISTMRTKITLPLVKQ